MPAELRTIGRISVLALLLFSSSARSIAPIAVTRLTPSNLDRLGFSLQIRTESDHSIFALLTGPKTGPNNCPAGGGGAGSAEVDGEEIAGFRYIQDSGDGRPASFAGFRTSGADASIYIDYVCPNGSGSETRRYLVESLKEHLDASKK